jgi:hypothetical protein
VIIAYWIVAGLLALVYLFAGGTKLVRSRAQLEQSGMTWAAGANHNWIVCACGHHE